ncbi:Angiopoietin-related protein 5 [Dissostichus eleginoides]|uniref:Angiopoietin-related protein 5 n=1 Tax=Dissostichus eleginoides TaxID=100907 RepID=A0AAD9EVT3_DISEL|nr:Angiopoietin-related protein 5 [Dissostichus eleginoides]
MMWTTTVLLLLVPHLLSSTETGNSANFNESDIVDEDFSDAPVKGQKVAGGVKGRDTCSIPTRKLIRDVMEEQQRALDILSSQVTELTTKVQTLNSEVQRSNTEMYSIKPVQSHGRDCSDIKDNLMSVVPKIPSGIYIVHPENTDSSFEVFCEMDYMGGGWTVMQRRTDGLTDFKRPWADYADGFGHLAGEHWLGLKKVFHIVNQKETRFQLHVALVSQDDICGSAGDAFRGYDQDLNQDTAPFSASDVDNDGCNPSCSFDNRTVESCSAQHNNTGWWFNQCGLANLNGSPEDTEQSQRTHIQWDTWRQSGVPHTIKSVTMKIRRIATNN